jgi:hypothetical protein
MHEILAGVSLEEICKPSLESGSIFMLDDLTPVPAPLPDLGAAASKIKEVAGEPSAAGSTKDSGAAISKPALAASQPDKASTSTDLGAVDPLVANVFHIREIPSWAEPFSNYLITGTCRRTKQKPGDSNATRRHTLSSIASCTSAVCLESFRSASSRKKEKSC